VIRALSGVGALLLASTALAQDALPLVVSDTGDGVRRLVEAQPFTLGEGTFEYDYVASHPSYSRGTLVVLAVDPALARPRDAAMPVLYVGAMPLQIVAQNASSTCVVGLVAPGVDLTVEPLFFGSTEPAERVDRARGAAERAAALAAGLKPRSAAELDAARVATRLSPQDATDLMALAKARVDRCD
jgi:hypothetical protein